jgi:hypothetical protein
MECRGSLEELQALVEGLGIPGQWVHKGAFEMFVVEDGESNLKLNWWPDTGALRLVGDPAQRHGLMDRLQLALSGRPAQG